MVLSLLVGEAHGQTVDLQLADVGHIVADDGTDAPVPGPYLLFLESVLEAEHRRAVADLGELSTRGASHALRRRVRSDQVRVLRFELLELAVQRVELNVGHLGLVEHVVEVLMPADLPAELLEPLLDVGRHSLARGAIVALMIFTPAPSNRTRSSSSVLVSVLFMTTPRPNFLCCTRSPSRYRC